MRSPRSVGSSTSPSARPAASPWTRADRRDVTTPGAPRSISAPEPSDSLRFRDSLPCLCQFSGFNGGNALRWDRIPCDQWALATCFFFPPVLAPFSRLRCAACSRKSSLSRPEEIGISNGFALQHGEGERIPSARIISALRLMFSARRLSRSPSSPDISLRKIRLRKSPPRLTSRGGPIRSWLKIF